VITTSTGRKLNPSNLRRDVLRSGGSMPSTRSETRHGKRPAGRRVFVSAVELMRWLDVSAARAFE
jgi:hypothetical protein